MSKRVLFVDDEPSILGIYEMLAPFIGEGCTVSTASGGEEALRLMDHQHFDVVVSDLTMPNMTGIQLLSEVSQRSPGTARIVVSGFTDELMAAKCLLVGHRYFGKPFNPTVLSTAVASLCDARSFAANEKIREFVGKIESLPTLSKTYMELTKAMRSNCLPVREVSAIIEKDLALTAKVLQMVNSVAIAPARRITTVFDAVQLIGFGVVRALVMGVQVFEFCSEITRTDLYQNVWSHSLNTAVCAKKLASEEGLPMENCDDAFFLGLLHDIGKVVLGASCREYHQLWRQCENDSNLLLQRETESYGANHAHIGAYLLRLWGLPAATTQSVFMHHAIDAAGIKEFNPQLAVHIAQELAPGRKKCSLNKELIKRLGLSSRIEHWSSTVEMATAEATR